MLDVFSCKVKFLSSLFCLCFSSYHVTRNFCHLCEIYFIPKFAITGNIFFIRKFVLGSVNQFIPLHEIHCEVAFPVLHFVYESLRFRITMAIKMNFSKF